MEPKKKVQLGIMSFYKKKAKKHGQGHPWKVDPPPQPEKKQKVEEAKTGHWNKYADYSNPAVAAVQQEAVEVYVSTGGKFPTHGDDVLTNQPIIHIPKRRICRDAEKLLCTNKPTNSKSPVQLNSGGSAVVMASHENTGRSLTSRSLTSESTRAFIAQMAKCQVKGWQLETGCPLSIKS
jgi:hypothetical protein